MTMAEPIASKLAAKAAQSAAMATLLRPLQSKTGTALPAAKNATDAKRLTAQADMPLHVIPHSPES